MPIRKFHVRPRKFTSAKGLGTVFPVLFVMESGDWVEMVHAEHESGMRLGEAIRRIAKKSGKTEQALKSAFYRRYPASEHNRNRIFSEEEEEVATLMIRSVSYLHLDWTRKQAREILEIAFKKAISESLLNRFCECHNDLFTS